jgi:hypothetical protein
MIKVRTALLCASAVRRLEVAELVSLLKVSMMTECGEMLEHVTGR